MLGSPSLIIVSPQLGQLFLEIDTISPQFGHLTITLPQNALIISKNIRLSQKL
jgi:hypothetical protein